MCVSRGRRGMGWGGSERTDREAACAVAAGGWPGCSGDKAPL